MTPYKYGDPIPETLCTSTGCDSECLDGCAKEGSICAIGRKHFIKGGVSCGDYGWCDRCVDSFYWEYLYLYDGPNLDKNEWSSDDFAEVCHCCKILLEEADRKRGVPANRSGAD